MRVVLAHGGDVSVPSGGHERVVAFATGLMRAGHEVTLVVPTPGGSLPERLGAVSVRTVDVPTGGVRTQPRRGLAIARTAQRLADEREARLQVEHSTLGGVASLFGRGYVLDVHDIAFTSPLYRNRPLGGALSTGIRWIEGRGLGGAGHVVVVSEQMRAFVVEEWDVPSDAISVIPNGYFEDDTASVVPDTAEGTRVVFVGTLHPKLDVEAVVSAAQLDAVDEMLVIGDGAMREELARAKRDRGLETLSVPGRLSTEATWSLVAGADVAINPQTQSPTQAVSSPVKLCYYRALGVPMVLSDGPELARQFAAEGVARVVGPAESFANVLDVLIGDGAQLDAMRSRAELTGGCATWAERAETLCDVFD
jgi:glycosyltransferase involved in cell wall biosynthesis